MADSKENSLGDLGCERVKKDQQIKRRVWQIRPQNKTVG